MVQANADVSQHDLFNFGLSMTSTEVVEEIPQIDLLPEAIRTRVSYNTETKIIEYNGIMTEDENKEIKKCFLTEIGKQTVDRLFNKSNNVPTQLNEPVQKKEERSIFKVPYLTVYNGDLFKIFEESDFLDTAWELSSYNYKLSSSEFSLQNDTAQVGEISISERGRVETRFVQELAEQLSLHIDVKGWTVADFANWLDRRIPHKDVTQTQATLFLYRVLNYLLDEREFEMSTLVHHKYKLLSSVTKLIENHREGAKKQAYQACLNLDDTILLVNNDFGFSYDKDIYPANWYYDGRHQFNKHYYPLIGELKNTGEEFECAQHIDSLPEIKHWVRNLERQPDYLFWLQTSTDKFYPDFVAELNDGRILVVEYKGAYLVTSDDSREKKALGELWASRSSGKCLFLMVSDGELSKIRNSFQS